MAVSAVAVAAVVAWHAAASAAGIGARYNAHDPRPCPTVKGATISAAVAKQLFICGAEGEQKSGASGDLLYLVSKAKVELGASRPFNPATDSVVDIDVRKPVYPIRGTFVEYQCGVVGTIGNPAGNNCLMANNTVARGECYNDTFGDWHCSMIGNVLGSAMVRNPPPTAP